MSFLKTSCIADFKDPWCRNMLLIPFSTTFWSTRVCYFYLTHSEKMSAQEELPSPSAHPWQPLSRFVCIICLFSTYHASLSFWLTLQSPFSRLIHIVVPNNFPRNFKAEKNSVACIFFYVFTSQWTLGEFPSFSSWECCMNLAVYTSVWILPSILLDYGFILDYVFGHIFVFRTARLYDSFF